MTENESGVRRLSAEGRERIAAAQKKRWEKFRRERKAAAKPAAKKS